MGVKKTIHHYHQNTCRIFRSCENITEITKEDYKKKKRLVKNIKVFPKKKKKKSNNMSVNDIQFSLKLKNKGWLSIEKYITRQKTLHYN